MHACSHVHQFLCVSLLVVLTCINHAVGAYIINNCFGEKWEGHNANPHQVNTLPGSCNVRFVLKLHFVFVCVCECLSV